MAIRIVGTGSYSPERILTNADLERMVDTSDEWIVTRTGIRERHIAEKSESTSDLAHSAAGKALANTGVAPEDIDLIVVATITPDQQFPSTACLLQKKLKAVNAVCFDVQAACSGLLYALQTVQGLMSIQPTYKTALVVGAEKLSSITDWSDRSTCVLFGDGAGAIVLKKTEGPDSENSIRSIRLGADGNYNNILQVPAGGTAMPATHETLDEGMHFLKMEGQEVFKLAVRAMASTCKSVMDEAGLTTDDIRWLIPHQANFRIINAVGKQLKLPQETVCINVDRYGNTSSASIILALDELNQSGQLDAGDHIILTAFGAGLTWGATLIQW